MQRRRVERRRPAATGNLSIDDTSIHEAGGSASFSVTLSPAPPSTVSVDFMTFTNTAGAGGDYEAAMGTRTFLAGQTQKTIAVDIVDDSVAEDEETFSVCLTNVAGNAALSRDEGFATIVDDDSASITTTRDGSGPGGAITGRPPRTGSGQDWRRGVRGWRFDNREECSTNVRNLI